MSPHVRWSLAGLAMGVFLITAPGSAGAKTFEVNSAAD